MDKIRPSRSTVAASGALGTEHNAISVVRRLFHLPKAPEGGTESIAHQSSADADSGNFETASCSNAFVCVCG